ncbi:hypothetical protein [Dictyobacter arantiisoli]|uniref:Uncharacterized protein n=1 Tax=Dictyobacter arantiisoli TaxID=2014874 RepID=A0A5A5T8V5_9CHLR|nr:hypothetical protein [Dictyobacter arantiisoli]GCF07344.1 hypothetical protein KDI_09080 [Dictyobacter arantiisoli]
MKHKITSYRQDELYTTPQEYETEANTDEEASAKIQQLRQSGYTISGWLQTVDQTALQPKKGK